MISVIIPVYQAERFLEKAVQSACDQQDVLEIILVEDNSTDNSLKICEALVTRYQPRVSLFRHPDGRNHGAGSSRNLGIQKAKCKFIAFLDADDFYLPDRFAHDMELLQNDPGIDGVYNAMGVHVYDEGERDRIAFELTTVKDKIQPNRLFEEMSPIGRGGYFTGSTLTVRRTIFDQVGYFDTTLELSQDTHMWIKMAAKASLAPGIIDRPVAMRGVHSSNRIKDTEKFRYYRPLVFSSLLQWANENNISSERRKLIWRHLYKVEKNSLISLESNRVSTYFKLFFLTIKNVLRYPGFSW